MRLLLLLLLMPLYSHAAVWTIHADMRTTHNDVADTGPFAIDGSFTTDNLGDVLTWDIFITNLNNIGNDTYFNDRLTDKCNPPADHFTGCSASHSNGMYTFFRWNGGRANYNLTVNDASGSLTSAKYGSYYYGLDLVSGTLTSAALPVPEPTTLIWLGIGLAGLYARLKRA